MDDWKYFCKLHLVTDPESTEILRGMVRSNIAVLQCSSNPVHERYVWMFCKAEYAFWNHTQFFVRLRLDIS